MLTPPSPLTRLSAPRPFEQRRAHPTLRCFAFGAPPVVDRRTAEESAPFIMCVALHNDLVCRLSLGALGRLRDDVLDCISRAKVRRL